MPRPRKSTRHEPYPTGRADRIADLRNHLLEQANLPSNAVPGDVLPSSSSSEPRENTQINAPQNCSAPSQSVVDVHQTTNNTGIDMDVVQAMITMAVNQANAPLLRKIESLEKNQSLDPNRTRHLYLSFDKKVIDDIQDRKFVDLKVLIKKSNNTNVSPKNGDKSCIIHKNGYIAIDDAKSKDLMSLDDWTCAFLRLISITIHIMSDENPDLVTSTMQDMLAYVDLIRHTALETSQNDWRTFDEDFCRLMANDPSISWANINNSLWLKSFTSNTNKHSNRSDKKTRTKIL